jgi:hypothetical protein
MTLLLVVGPWDGLGRDDGTERCACCYIDADYQAVAPCRCACHTDAGWPAVAGMDERDTMPSWARDASENPPVALSEYALAMQAGMGTPASRAQRT